MFTVCSQATPSNPTLGPKYHLYHFLTFRVLKNIFKLVFCYYNEVKKVIFNLCVLDLKSLIFSMDFSAGDFPVSDRLLQVLLVLLLFQGSCFSLSFASANDDY